MASTALANRYFAKKNQPARANIIPLSGNSFARPGSLYTAPPNFISGNDVTNSWYTAGNPIAPIAPSGTEPRGWQYWSQQNQNFTPRTTEILTFDELRGLANYPLARFLIDVRKDQIATMKWQIRVKPQPGETNKQRLQREKNDDTVKMLTEFWEHPNPDCAWRDFASMWIDDVLVIDAPALLLRRNKASKIAQVRAIDGCYSADTEVLTDAGWKLFSEVDINRDRFATRNCETKAFEWQSASAYTCSHYLGQMISFVSRTLDLLVTPNHRMLVKPIKRTNRPSRENVKPAEALIGSRAMTAIPSTSRWIAPDVEAFSFPDAETISPRVLKGFCHCGCGRKTRIASRSATAYGWEKGEPVRYVRGHQAHLRAKSGFTISGDDFAAFMGMYLSEGSTSKGKNSHFTVYVTQLEKSRGYKLFSDLLTRVFGVEPKRTGISWRIAHRSLHDYLTKFGHAHQKYVPQEIMGMSSRQLRIFWDFYALGDGECDRDRISTVSKRMADQLQEIAQKIGLSAGLAVSIATRDARRPDGKPILLENIRPRYIIALRSSIEQQFKASTESYDGMVYCVTVPNGILYVRRKGNPAWCGNSMIARYIDDNGWTPQNGSPAYAQLWWGAPAWDLTTDQLIYRPRNPRTYKLYGHPPTEKAAPVIQVGQKRLEYLLQYYENGSIPDGFMVVPPNASPSQIEQQQAWLTSTLAGNLARKVQLRLIQGFSPEGKDQIVFPKEKLLTDSTDEWVIRMLCFNYGIPVQRLLKQMNRASAESSQEAAEEEGEWPDIKYVIDTVNLIIQSPQYMNSPNHEFALQDQRERDVSKQSAADKIYVDSGIRTRNQVLEALGDDPSSDPMANVLTITTGQGAIPLDAAQKAIDAASDETDEQDKEDDAANQIAPPRKLKRRRAIILNGDALLLENKNAITKFIRQAMEDGKFSKSHPRMTIDPNHFTLSSEKARNSIDIKLKDHLQKVASAIVAKVNSATKKVRKLDDQENNVNEILNDDEFWVSLWSTLPAELAPDLEAAVLAGSSKGVLEGDVHITEAKLINELNVIARDWAKDRAAELIGMKYTKDGELISNPNAAMVISDTTRDQVRKIVTEAFEHETTMADLTAAIQDAGTFGYERAAAIAKDQVARAQAHGTAAVWQRLGLVKTAKWQHSNAPGVCPECIANAEAGEVDFGKPYPSGDLWPPAHPGGCRCVLVAVKIERKKEAA